MEGAASYRAVPHSLGACWRVWDGVRLGLGWMGELHGGRWTDCGLEGVDWTVNCGLCGLWWSVLLLSSYLTDTTIIETVRAEERQDGETQTI